MAELIKLKGEFQDYFQLVGYEEDKDLSVFYVLSEDRLICSYGVGPGTSKEYNDMFSLKFVCIDQESSLLKHATFSYNSTPHSKIEYFKEFLKAIYVTSIGVKNNHRFDPEVINFTNRIKGSMVDTWGLYQNLLNGQMVNYEELINLKNRTITKILDFPDYKALRNFEMFENKDEEDLIIEIAETKSPLFFIQGEQIDESSKLSNFFLDRYNYLQAILLLMNSSLNLRKIGKTLYFFTHPLVHVLFLLVGFCFSDLWDSSILFWITSIALGVVVIYLTPNVVLGTVVTDLHMEKNKKNIIDHKYLTTWKYAMIIFLIVILSKNISVPFSLSIIIYSSIWTGFLLFIFPLLFLFNRDKSYFSESPSFSLLTPNLVISNIIGWFLILPILNFIWPLNPFLASNEFIFIVLILMLLFVIFVFIYNEIRIVKPNVSFTDAIQRVFVFLFRGLPISLFFGILLMSITYPLVMTNSKVHFSTPYLPTVIKALGDVDELPILLNKELYSPISEASFNGKPLLIKSENMHDNSYLLVAFDELKSDLNRMDSLQLLNDSTGTSESKYISLQANCLQILDKFNTEYIDNALSIKYKELAKLADEECAGSNFPYMSPTNLTTIPFVFPPLLILGATMSFLVGFFIQFVRSSKTVRYRE